MQKRLNNLKWHIIQTGKPQAELCFDVRISETKLSRIVNGRQEATTEEKKRLVDVLKVSEEILFKKR